MEHHDGFALYHSKVSKYNCYDATPWRRDPMKELQQALAEDANLAGALSSARTSPVPDSPLQPEKSDRDAI